MLNAARIAELKQEVGEEDFAEVLGIFCEEVEEVLSELQTDVPAVIAEKLHFLKGSALNIGMEQVGELCRAQEERLKKTPDVVPDIAAIVAMYQSSKSELMG